MAELSMTPVIEKIVDILGPYMGAKMVRSSLKVYITEIVIQQGSFEMRHLDRLVERIKPGLKAFVGEQKALSLTQEILKLKTSPLEKK